MSVDVYAWLLHSAYISGLYLIPWFVADHREHKQVTPIFALNLMFGWTIVGWGVALIWALREEE